MGLSIATLSMAQNKAAGICSPETLDIPAVLFPDALI